MEPVLYFIILILILALAFLFVRIGTLKRTIHGLKSKMRKLEGEAEDDTEMQEAIG